MRLLLIRPATDYEVLIAADPFGNFQCVGEITSLYDQHLELWDEVSGTLYDRMPMQGPRVCRVKDLHKGVLEFCFGGLPRPAFRVLWFEGETPKHIVCSNAFMKQPAESTPSSALSTAIRHRLDYFSGEEHEIEIMEGVLG